MTAPTSRSLAQADGVHVGQDDLPAADARAIVGPAALVGLSTHNRRADAGRARRARDYIAIGPVFGTTSKARPIPWSDWRACARRGDRSTRAGGTPPPLVAIGGITLERAAAVIEAGASAVAIISDLTTSDAGARARAFLHAVA